MRIEVRDGAESRSDIGPLAAAVYPPQVLATIVWRNVASARATLRVLVFDNEMLVAAAGTLFRKATLNGHETEHRRDRRGDDAPTRAASGPWYAPR